MKSPLTTLLFLVLAATVSNLVLSETAHARAGWLCAIFWLSSFIFVKMMHDSE